MGAGLSSSFQTDVRRLDSRIGRTGGGGYPLPRFTDLDRPDRANCGPVAARKSGSARVFDAFGGARRNRSCVGRAPVSYWQGQRRRRNADRRSVQTAPPRRNASNRLARLDRYYELFLRAGNRRAFILQFEQDSYTDSDRIKTIAIPTLILWGGLDPVVPVRDAERFHQDIAHSELVVFSQLATCLLRKILLSPQKRWRTFWLVEGLDREMEKPMLSRVSSPGRFAARVLVTVHGSRKFRWAAPRMLPAPPTLRITGSSLPCASLSPREMDLPCGSRLTTYFRTRR